MFRPRRKFRLPRPGGGIGRHAVLRGQWREPSRFESGPGHCREFPRHCHRSSVVELSIRNRVVDSSTLSGGSFP